MSQPAVVRSAFLEVEWISGDLGPPEIRETSAQVRIVIEGQVATEVEDRRSKSVRSHVFLALYPLALWVASSWWRLRWEPEPATVSLADMPASRWNPAWRMAHELAAAGHGFLWPPLAFVSDCEAVEVLCLAGPAPSEPLRYLNSFRRTLPARRWEELLDDLLDLVLGRLDAVGQQDTDLHRLWREVCQERVDPEMTQWRKLEAQLGFEPDEAPEGLMEQLLRLSADAGAPALSELAPVCAGADPAGALNAVLALARQQGIRGRIELPGSLQAQIISPSLRQMPPLQRGWELARALRTQLDLGDNPVPDARLLDLLQIPGGCLDRPPVAPERAPISLAIRQGDGDLSIIFRKCSHPSLRFEAARLLADGLLAAEQEGWLPVTRAGTARQKFQRAFASEFLCPIHALTGYLDNDLSAESFDGAGQYFGVSPLAVRSTLVNHGIIASEWVPA